MKLMTQIGFVALAALAFASCKKNAAADAAAKMCDCAKPMVEIYQKMEALKEKPEELAKLAGDAQKIGTDMESCVKELETKYADKKDDQAFEKEVQKAMETKCPDIAKVINSAGAGAGAEEPGH
jgi:predicted trehalose synthase